MKNWKDWGATILGVATAIAAGLLVVDWKDFHFQKEWPKLIMLAVVAAGGYFSKLKIGKDENNHNHGSETK